MGSPMQEWKTPRLAFQGVFLEATEMPVSVVVETKGRSWEEQG